MSVTLRSAVPGRERWQIEPLRSHPRYAAALERELSLLPPIRSAWANPITGRLLVEYDPRAEVRHQLDAAIDAEPLSHDETREWRTSWPRGFTRSPLDRAVDLARTRMILSGTLFAGMVAKRALLGAGMFAASPIFATASSVLTIISGYNVLRSGFNALSGKAGVDGRTIYTLTALSLHVAADSIDGIGALFAANTFEWLEAKSLRDMGATMDVTPRARRQDSLISFNTAALLGSGGVFLLTGDAEHSLAMLLGGVPLASKEALVAANALSLHNAVKRGIRFRDVSTLTALRDPDATIQIAIASRDSEETIAAADVVVEKRDDVDEAVRLIRRTSNVVNQSEWVSRAIGAAGFTAAAFGQLSPFYASKLHNYTRLAMEVNSLRLAGA
jgi:cation transport ATPase